MKKYLDKNVYEAALERFRFVFQEFDNYYLSVSGGKDSSVMVQLANQLASELGVTFDVLYMDFEAQYQYTIEHIAELKQLSQIGTFYHCCLQFKEDNGLSMFQPEWVTWDPNVKQDWIRPIPPDAIHDGNHPFDFYNEEPIEDFDFQVYFADWYQRKHGGKVACGVAIRSDESLNRWRTIASDKKETYKALQWTTKVKSAFIDMQNVYNFYPLYDWQTQDIWIAVSKIDLMFNQVYEEMYKAGVSIHDQRLCQPFGIDQRQGLDLYAKIEPETWELLLKRVGGVNTGNIYCRTELLGHLKSSKPDHMTWEQYAIFMLESIWLVTPEIAEHYMDKIKRVFDYHNNYYNTEITDEDTKQGLAYCSWEEIAKSIEKNDFWFKRLSFSETKKGYEKLQKMKEKYSDMLGITTKKIINKSEKKLYGKKEN